MGLLVFLLLVSWGCMPRQPSFLTYKTDTSYTVGPRTKFASGPIHVEGKASCAYILFTIPLCKRQDLSSVAWQKVYRQAKIEGLSAQFVNVTHDAYLTSNFFYIFFIDHHAISADVIVYEKLPPG